MGSEILQGRAVEMPSEFRRNGDLDIRTVEVDAEGHVRKTTSERRDGHLNLRSEQVKVCMTTTELKHRTRTNIRKGQQRRLLWKNDQPIILVVLNL